MIELSVIIPIFNAASFLSKCVDSLSSQTKKTGVEYIFVDDGSTDDSVHILRSLLVSNSSFSSSTSVFCLPDHRGVGAAREEGIRHARGNYITFCDADDWVDSDIYEVICRHIVQSHSDIIVQDFIIYGIRSEECFSYSDQKIDNRLISGHWWMLWSHTVKRSLLQDHQITFVDGINFWEDMDFLMRVYHFAQNISYIHRPLYHYNCTNPQSFSSTNSGLSLLPSCQRVIDHLSSFYQEQHVEPPVRLLALKQFTRDLYLKHSPVDWSAWRKRYPESWRYVWRDSTFKFFYRIAYTLASWGITSPFRLYLYCSHIKHR